MALANVSIQVLPLVEEKDLYAVVDKVIEYIDSCGVKYEVGPMETTMEGELSQLLNIVEAVQNICVEQGASRVASVVKIDYRPTGITMKEKIAKYRK